MAEAEDPDHVLRPEAGTSVVDVSTARVLAISVPRGETSVLQHFQAQWRRFSDSLIP